MRYTEERIIDVLDLYWPLQSEPIEGIDSQFYYPPAIPTVDHTADKEIETNPSTDGPKSELFFERKRNVSIVPLLSHTYITFRDRVWHPGAPTNPIIDPVKECELQSPLMSIRELCIYCARKFMYGRFDRDAHFHIICNNCQIQFGLFGDTILVMSGIVLLITNIYEPTLIKTLLLIYVCFILLLVNTSALIKDSLQLYHCAHIQHGLGQVCSV